MWVDKLQKKLKILFKDNAKQKVIIILGFVGIALIVLSEITPSFNEGKREDYGHSYAEYIASLEKKTSNIVSSISGAGKCKVMITLSSTDENIYAKNIDESKNESSNSIRSEYVFYEDNSNDSPVLIKQYFPKVEGVAVVCAGGDNVNVREQIIFTLSALFDIPSNKISVTKLYR